MESRIAHPTILPVWLRIPTATASTSLVLLCTPCVPSPSYTVFLSIPGRSSLVSRHCHGSSLHTVLSAPPTHNSALSIQEAKIDFVSSVMYCARAAAITSLKGQFVSPACPFCREHFTRSTVRLIHNDFNRPSSGWSTPRRSLNSPRPPLIEDDFAYGLLLKASLLSARLSLSSHPPSRPPFFPLSPAFRLTRGGPHILSRPPHALPVLSSSPLKSLRPGRR